MYIMAVDRNKRDLKHLIDTVREIYTQAEFVMFSDPVAALEYVKVNPIDVLFTTVGMNGVSGITLAEETKECQPAVPIVFVTDDESDAEYAFKLKVNGFVLKPVKKDNIINALAETKFSKI